MLFDDAYEKFKIYVQYRHKKQGYITISNDFNNRILPYFKGTIIENISKNDILKWYDDILKLNYSNKYNAKIYYTFNYFLNFCVTYSYISCNYLKEIHPFPKKIEIKNYTIYNIHQLHKFIFCLDDFVIKQYFNFIYFYGTRPGETMALKFSDINSCYVRIIHNLQRKGQRELDTPKNQSSVRAFRVNLIQVFRFHLLKYYYKKIYGFFSNDYYVFGGPKPLAPTTIDRHKKIAIKKANLPYITQHEFRHSYASRLIHKKVSIDKVSHSMGHSKVSTTLDIYLHQEKNTLNVFPH